MSELNCEYVRDSYPDLLNGSADAALAASVRAHIATCEECRTEVALIDALHARRSHVPDDLHARVAAAVLQQRPRRRFSRSAMAMAATLAAAVIGGSVIMQTQLRTSAPVATQPQPDAQLGLGFVGVEDAMLSGESSLDDLSVEQLEQLLGEIES